MPRNKSVSNVVSITPEPASVSPLLYDIPATARIMSTTTFAIRELCRSGRLKFVRIGHRWLVSTAAMRNFISQAERSTLTERA